MPVAGKGTFSCRKSSLAVRDKISNRHFFINCYSCRTGNDHDLSLYPIKWGIELLHKAREEKGTLKYEYELFQVKLTDALLDIEAKNRKLFCYGWIREGSSKESTCLVASCNMELYYFQDFSVINIEK